MKPEQVIRLQREIFDALANIPKEPKWDRTRRLLDTTRKEIDGVMFDVSDDGREDEP